MFALTLRGLAARKLRGVLTGFAVVLGVALMAGTYVFTDTINASFDKLFVAGNKGTDVRIRARETVRTDNGEVPAFAQSYLAQVRRTPGVAKASGAISFRTTSVFTATGKTVGSGGAPRFVSSAEPEPFNPFEYAQGRAPAAAGEAAIDSVNAKKKDLAVGDVIKIGALQGARPYRLVGIATFAGGASLGGAVIVITTLPEAQRITGNAGKVDSISVAAAAGTSPRQLRDRLRAELPRTLDVRTGAQDAAKASKDLRDNLGFLRTFLLVFAGVALFVGAFIIFNTFSITVSQRTREFALLRTLGASRRQVITSVFGEALLLGVVASVIGLGAGIGLAPLLNAFFKALGVDLPNEGVVVAGRTVAVSVIVGTVVAVVAGLVPARRATRVPPILATREGAVLPVSARRRRRQLAAAVATTVAGVVLLCVGLFGGGSSGRVGLLLGLGVGLMFVGVAMVSPRLVRPLANAFGWPLERLRGVTGRIARENAERNPSRTAITAASLMIGLALVAFVAIFAHGLKASISGAIDDAITGQVVVQNTDGFSPIPAAAGPAIEKLVPGVEVVSATRFSAAKVRGVKGTPTVTSLEPRTAARVFHLDWKRGSDATIRQLGAAGAIIDEKWGKDHDIRVGSTIDALTPTAKRVRLEVIGSVDNRSQLIGDFAISTQAIERDFGVLQDAIQVARLAPGADAGKVRRQVDALLKRDFPAAEASTKEEFKDKQTGNLDSLLGLVYGMLALSVIVSLFGIVNTLALSVYERTRELGMLRAIGMSRRQVRRLVRYEAVITALIGATLGTVLGVFFAVIVSRPLADEGFTLSIPVGTLIGLMVGAAVAGVLAAILPARRAADLKVLDALAVE